MEAQGYECANAKNARPFSHPIVLPQALGIYVSLAKCIGTKIDACDLFRACELLNEPVRHMEEVRERESAHS